MTVADEHAAIGDDEAGRAETLGQLGLLDGQTEQVFDDLARLAARLCRTPCAAVSLLDDERQWFRGRSGFDLTSTSKDVAFCRLVVRGQRPLTIPDAHLDERFATNPLVTGPPGIRAYAGSPIAHDGIVVGSVCAFDTDPHPFTPEDLDWLELLARQASSHIESRAQTALVVANMLTLADAQQELQEASDDLAAVTSIVQDILVGGDASQTVVEAVARLADAEHVVLTYPRPGADRLVVTASTTPQLAGMEIDIGADAVSCAAHRTDAPVFVADTADDPRVSGTVHLTGSRSMYAVPIHIGDTTATISVGWMRRVADLDDRRTRVVRLLADHAGVALRQAELVNELAGLALEDPLTGLPNRRHWDRHLLQLVDVAGRTHLPLVVAVVDLDHFKAYNDRHGHDAGDRLLADFAVAAREKIRGSDTIARWGGEEFAVALPSCPPYLATAILGRLAVSVPDGQTCSIGHATWDGTETAAELFKRADEAVYQAKRQGRHAIVAADVADAHGVGRAGARG